ncbi:ABC transporter G family member 31-like [Magnolia sinica]|uniref:ABC transporter G family member 31-like n=1 Tax=Magnolia sinica TaxID=86752 RepID=UPI00265A94E2|nr:ABC transporter G family member 31-like [Magnolia sinica]
MAALNGREYFEIDMDQQNDAFPRPLNAEALQEDENELLWAAIERLPSQKRLNFAIMGRNASKDGRQPVIETFDVRKLDRTSREQLVRNAMATNEPDNYTLLSNIKERLDRMGLQVPNVEVRFEGLTVTADVQIGKRALPTLLNYVRNTIEGLLTSLGVLRVKSHSLTILNNISGFVKPGRMTLLLGPPASGKSTLLLALAGKLGNDLKTSGKVTYNGHTLDEFFVQRTSAYISQTDNHIADLTVRETLDFAARFQGASHGFAVYVDDLAKLEKEKNIRPIPAIDAFMKASSVGGKRHSLTTDYVLRVLGLDDCSDTLVGDDMQRGVSGGQRKRVTTGEMVVGPRKILFMDEISTGLDSSTTFQIVKCIRNFVHQMEGTVLMALLQPAPETFDLFDDIILLSEGHVVYHGPRADVVDFFVSLGFSLPPRKGVADFLQEVTSKKDQAQYWSDPSKPYVFLPVSEIANAFKQSKYGRSIESTLSVPYDKTKSLPSALANTKFAVAKSELLKACFSRELLLMSRHRFLYLFRTFQVAFVGTVACTMFLRTRLHPTDEVTGNLYLSCLFYGMLHIFYDGFSELPIMISRLPVFYKQRNNFFHPAWAYSISSWILRLPYSAIEAVVWSCVVYYSVGFAPGIGRFFRFVLLLFSLHQMGLGIFRMLAAVARDMTIANTFGSASLFILILLGGFLIPKDMVKPWLVWATWISPISYGQRAISVNEFGATRWMKKSSNGNTTIGYNVLHSHGLPVSDDWYWIGIGVLLGYSFLFNILVTISLAYLQPLLKAKAMIPVDDTKEKNGNVKIPTSELRHTSNKGMILPFRPLSMTFHNLNYFVDMPKARRQKGVPERKLQLLSNVSGVFRPCVLTALVGSSGAGKTTLMDVLAGRKTGGYIEGDISLSGYPKEQSTFARISGYVEQNDIHSPQVTVEESLLFSACLRLPKEVKKEKQHEFVEEVMALVELDTLRHALVGLPGRSGLSTEQRKRLTIAVELVANPSIIFLDEPTSGLDARAAAIVMRTVRNTADTGRTVVCTIHQPSIDLFEAFDELLLMKRGGRVIYGGKLGVNSQIVINYFQGIDGVAPIPEGYNPATWMLEVTTQACEERIGQDFATIYRNSDEYREVEALIQQLSVPAAGSEPLKFDSKYSQNSLTQFKACLWKQNLVYWRSPEYNVMRLLLTTISALILGLVFWKVGSKRDTTKDLFTVMGALYSACLFLGVNNASSIQPIVSIERTVFYREKATGMYSPFPYAAAQGVIEVPYIAMQTILYGVITYFMIGFERTIGKFLLYLLFMFLTFTYFVFYGLMAVGLTPTEQFSAVVSSTFYSLWNLMSGFLVPKPNIPRWWIWFYYLNPVAWTLQGIITSQLGNVESRVVGPGFDGSVQEFLEVSLGYSPGMTGIAAVVLLGFIFLFFGIYATSVKVLNFQRR